MNLFVLLFLFLCKCTCFILNFKIKIELCNFYYYLCTRDMFKLHVDDMFFNTYWNLIAKLVYITIF